MSNNTEQIRTRIAPSPTGFPHLGSIYNALFNKIFAKINNGNFIWRSEDTDRTRYVTGAEEALDEALKWFNLEADEDPFKGGPYGPYRQSERLSIYRKYVMELVDKGHAYYCFCKPERLEEVRKQAEKEKRIPMYDRHCLKLTKEEIKQKLDNNESYVIRMKIPENEKIVCHDLIRGDITFDSNTIDDQVLLKSDGYPTYHLAVVIDDYLMKISHVIRGHGWLPSFPKQKLLIDMFGWPHPIYAHFPDVLNIDKKGKLSKRDASSNIEYYRTKGYLPESILNFLSLLGWSHPNEKEIFSIDEFMATFRLEDMSANLPKFDIAKLDWMNGEYIRSKSNIDLYKNIIDWLKFILNLKIQSEIKENYRNFSDFLSSLDTDSLELFLNINKERIKKFEDLLLLNNFYFNDNFDNDQVTKNITKYKSKEEVKKHLEWFISELKKSNWTQDDLKSLEAKVRDKALDMSWKNIEAFYPIRIAITGNEVSPPLFESIYILGKDKSLKHINSTINLL